MVLYISIYKNFYFKKKPNSPLFLKTTRFLTGLQFSDHILLFLIPSPHLQLPNERVKPNRTRKITAPIVIMAMRFRVNGNMKNAKQKPTFGLRLNCTKTVQTRIPDN